MRTSMEGGSEMRLLCWETEKRGGGELKEKPKVLIDDISTKARWFKGWKVRKGEKRVTRLC